MISGETTVIVERVRLRVARVSQGQHVATVTQRDTGQFAVISGGLQGPVGTVAEDVLARAEAAEQAAAVAQDEATQTTTDLTDVVTRLNNAFAYHAGAISAQEG